LSQPFIAAEPDDSRRQLVRPFWRDEEARLAVDNDFGYAANAGSDTRERILRGLEEHQAKRLVPLGQNEKVRRGVEQPRVVDVAQK